MRKLFPDYLIITLKGLAMGAADVVPGVSGGTIAFISGIYQELIDSINNVNISVLKTLKNEGLKAAWKQVNGSFLLALLSGIGISILTFSKVITHLLETQPILVWSFFFGLIIASITLIWKEITSWKLVDILFLLNSILLLFKFLIELSFVSISNFLVPNSVLRLSSPSLPHWSISLLLALQSKTFMSKVIAFRF